MNCIIEGSEKWFVWTKTGRTPKFAHDTEASALEEAQRLAFKCPGKKFHVMRSVAKVCVQIEPLAPAEEVAA